jgi:predicted nucleic acid-binding protein
MVIVDSNVWIHFMKAPGTPAGQEMTKLLRASEVATVGVVLFEVLQGMRSQPEFDRIKSRMLTLGHLEASRDTWVRAAEVSIDLQRSGRPTPFSDIMIAALGIEHDVPVYTLDQHFQHIPGLKLYQPQY